MDHLIPILGNWRRGEDLRADLASTEQTIKEQQNALNEQRADLESIRVRRDAVTTQFSSYGTPSFVIVAIGVGVAIFTLVGGIVTIAIGVLVGYLSAKKLKQRFSEEMVKAEVAIAQADSAVAEATSRKATMDSEIAERSAGFPVVRMVHARFLLKAKTISSRNLLLDASGIHDQTVLRAVDVSALQEGLSDISASVEALLAVPPLLTPDFTSPPEDPVHQLFGEEDRLQQLVSDFTVNLGKLKDIDLRLPLVPRQSILVRRMMDGDLSPVDTNPAIAVIDGKISEESIQSFVSDVQQTRERGAHVFAELKNVYANLDQACSLYSDARISSVNAIHQSLTEVLNRAAWCSRRFYCPRTILSPRYLEELLNINPQNAFVLALDDLIERLRGDGEVSKRLTEKSELLDQLSDAYYAIQEFMEGLSFDEDGDRIDRTTRPKHIEDQYRESIKRFAGVLQKIMTGSTYPILNFSPAAQLYFDPATDQWLSDSVPYTYSTPDILKYGGVVKAYSDLMIPLWEHLWTEKADFRKSELFRTNESMIRMTEKESEKLIDIANQYRADMRTVRENVHIIEADLKSKYTEIVGFRDGMDKLGLLTDRVKTAISDDKLSAIIMGDPMLSSIDRSEMVLGAMPQSQAENRGTVHDPIDLAKEPSVLVTYKTHNGPRLLSS